MLIRRHSTTAAIVALPGVTRRTLVHGPRMLVCEFTLEKGHDLPIHTHPHEQAGYIVSGHIRLTIAGETFDLGPGDSYYAEPNVPHGATILETAVVVDTFTPPREDYVHG